MGVEKGNVENKKIRKVKSILIKIAIALAVIMVVDLLVGGVCGSITIRLKNDIYLTNMQNKLVDVVEDAGIKVIETKKVCGKLSGNGNGMDFFAAVLINANGVDKGALEKILSEKLKKYEATGVIVQEGTKVDINYVELGELVYSKEMKEGEVYYTVYVFDGGHSSYGDVRGH